MVTMGERWLIKHERKHGFKFWYSACAKKTGSKDDLIIAMSLFANLRDLVPLVSTEANLISAIPINVFIFHFSRI